MGQPANGCLASEQDFPLWRARAEFLRGWGLGRTGLTQEGLALSRCALADYEATGSGQWLPYFLALLSEAEGPGVEALELLDDGLARVQKTGEPGEKVRGRGGCRPVAASGAEAVTGVILALLILLPEGLAALSAARRDALQTSLNLALGSSLATIGLTVPAGAVVALVLKRDLVLGLDPQDSLLLGLTIVVSLLTFGTGRTNILYGFVHLVIFATFVFLVFVP